MDKLKSNWPWLIFPGLIGLYWVGSVVQNESRKASQLDALERMGVAFDVEAASVPWCVVALLNGQNEAEGTLPWKAGEAAALGELQFQNLGYGKTYPEEPVTATYKGEVYTLVPVYEEPGHLDLGADVLSVRRTCQNVEIIVR